MGLGLFLCVFWFCFVWVFCVCSFVWVFFWGGGGGGGGLVLKRKPWFRLVYECMHTRGRACVRIIQGLFRFSYMELFVRRCEWQRPFIKLCHNLHWEHRYWLPFSIYIFPVTMFSCKWKPIPTFPSVLWPIFKDRACPKVVQNLFTIICPVVHLSGLAIKMSASDALERPRVQIPAKSGLKDLYSSCCPPRQPVRVSTKTGWPGFSVLWLVRNVGFAVSASVWQHIQLFTQTYTLHVNGL